MTVECAKPTPQKLENGSLVIDVLNGIYVLESGDGTSPVPYTCGNVEYSTLRDLRDKVEQEGYTLNLQRIILICDDSVSQKNIKSWKKTSTELWPRMDVIVSFRSQLNIIRQFVLGKFKTKFLIYVDACNISIFEKREHGLSEYHLLCTRSFKLTSHPGRNLKMFIETICKLLTRMVELEISLFEISIAFDIDSCNESSKVYNQIFLKYKNFEPTLFDLRGGINDSNAQSIVYTISPKLAEEIRDLVDSIVSFINPKKFKDFDHYDLSTYDKIDKESGKGFHELIENWTALNCSLNPIQKAVEPTPHGIEAREFIESCSSSNISLSHNQKVDPPLGSQNVQIQKKRKFAKRSTRRGKSLGSIDKQHPKRNSENLSKEGDDKESLSATEGDDIVKGDARITPSSDQSCESKAPIDTADRQEERADSERMDYSDYETSKSQKFESIAEGEVALAEPTPVANAGIQDYPKKDSDDALTEKFSHANLNNNNAADNTENSSQEALDAAADQVPDAEYHAGSDQRAPRDVPPNQTSFREVSEKDASSDESIHPKATAPSNLEDSQILEAKVTEPSEIPFSHVPLVEDWMKELCADDLQSSKSTDPKLMEELRSDYRKLCPESKNATWYGTLGSRADIVVESISLSNRTIVVIPKHVRNISYGVDIPAGETVRVYERLLPTAYLLEASPKSDESQILIVEIDEDGLAECTVEINALQTSLPKNFSGSCCTMEFDGECLTISDGDKYATLSLGTCDRRYYDRSHKHFPEVCKDHPVADLMQSGSQFGSFFMHIHTMSPDYPWAVHRFGSAIAEGISPRTMDFSQTDQYKIIAQLSQAFKDEGRTMFISYSRSVDESNLRLLQWLAKLNNFNVVFVPDIELYAFVATSRNESQGFMIDVQARHTSAYTFEFSTDDKKLIKKDEKEYQFGYQNCTVEFLNQVREILKQCSVDVEGAQSLYLPTDFWRNYVEHALESQNYKTELLLGYKQGTKSCSLTLPYNNCEALQLIYQQYTQAISERYFSETGKFPAQYRHVFMLPRSYLHATLDKQLNIFNDPNVNKKIYISQCLLEYCKFKFNF